MQRYNGQLLNQFPNTVTGISAAGAQITVRVKSTGALATLYANNSIGGATLSNPLTADEKGFYSFYAPDGVYTLDVSLSGTPQLEIQLQDVASLQSQFNNAVSNAGYIPVGTFAAGCTVSQANGVVSDGASYWRWDGALPKTVTAGSSPTPTGVSGWILVSDGSLGANSPIINSRVNKWVCVTDPAFGADNTGGSFATDAFMAAQAASNFIIVPAGTYSLDPTKKVRIFSGKTWLFLNPTFTKPAGAGTMFAAEFESNFNLLGSARFLGNATATNIQDNTGFTGETGLYIESCSRYKVENLNFRNMAGYGLKMSGTAGASPYFGERGRFSGISASVCHYGMDIDAGNGSEYNTFVNYDLSANRVGLRLGAGNNTFSGGSITGNRYANVQLTGGSNNGHGTMSSTTINHAGVYNLLAENVTVGFTFADCMWYGNAPNSSSGQIFIRNSEGICIDGGHLDCWVTVWKESSTGYNTVRNMWCPAGYGKVKLDDESGSGLYPRNLIVSGCFGAGSRDSVTGASINSKDCEVVLVRGPNGGQILTNNAWVVLQFPNAANVLSDNRRAWNQSTNVFTAPVQMGGIYSVNGRITLQTTGTIDVNQTKLRILKNGTQLQVFRPYSKGLASDATDICSIDINLEALLIDGDTLQFEVKQVGTGTPVFADPDGQMVIRIEKRQ